MSLSLAGTVLLRRYALARAALAVGACAFLLPSGMGPAWLVAVLAIAASSVIAVYVAGDAVRQLLSVIAGDLLLALAMVPVTGGDGSPFLPLLYMAVVFAGTHFGVRAGCVAAALSIVVLHVALLSAGTPVDGAFGAREAALLFGDRESVVGLYAAAAFLAITGVSSGYLGLRYRRRNYQLARVRSELARRRLDTDAIIESLSTGLISVGQNGRIVLINHAAQETLSIPEIPPDRSVGRVLGGRLEGIGAALLESLATGKGSHRVLVPVEDPDGTERIIGLSTVAVRREYEVVGVVGIFRDITEIKAEEAEQRRRDRLASIGELAAGVVHELRNILKPLSGAVEILDNDLKNDAGRRDYIRLVRDECDALEAFVEQILEFSADAPFETERFDARELLETVVTWARRHPAGAGATVEVDDAPWIEIEADRSALQRTLMNLVLNGLQASPKGTVRLSIVREDRATLIRVSDDGPGVDADRVHEVFEPFVTGRPGGTGLGLAIAKRTVERHDGSIGTGRSELGGAEFTVRIPDPAEDAESREAA